MESTSLPSLLHDPGRYVSSHNVLCARSAEFSVYADWVNDVFYEAVVAKLQAKLDEQEELRILGVGGGSGEKDCSMLMELLQRFPRINNRVVDPIHDQIVQYQALAGTKAHELHGVSCDWRQQTIEQYEEAGDLTKFHFISAVHSFYGVDDVDGSFMYLYDRLEPGGILLVMLMNDKCGWTRFWTRFPSLVGQHNRSSADVRSSLDRRGIPYKQYHQPSSVNITECFDGTSEEGRLLVDFLTHVANFQETASEDLQRSVMEYLASSDCCEKKGDEVWLNGDWDAVIISKPL